MPLENLFGSRSIALNTPHIWPRSSPDLNPFDFTIWGRAKSDINGQAPQTREELVHSIEQHFESFSAEVIQNCRRNFLKRIELIIEQGGNLIEQYM